MTSIPFDDAIVDDLRRTMGGHATTADTHKRNAASCRARARENEREAARAAASAAQYQALIDHATGVPPAPPPAVDERARLVAGLREFADFIEAEPGFPADVYISPRYFPSNRGHAAAAEQMAEVDRIAAVLGVTADRNGSHYRARREFGPVDFEATATDVTERTPDE